MVQRDINSELQRLLLPFHHGIKYAHKIADLYTVQIEMLTLLTGQICVEFLSVQTSISV